VVGFVAEHVLAQFQQLAVDHFACANHEHKQQ